MDLYNFRLKAAGKIASIVQKYRVILYSLLSNIKVNAKKYQPVLADGTGKIIIGKNVCFGVNCSPGFYSQYTYLNARKAESYIQIGDNCWINNSATIISDGAGIVIGNNCLIGVSLEITDSDFHDLNPRHRFGGKNIIRKKVIIGNNVFLGNNVTVLKGVTIGDNSVIGGHSVVTKNIPENVIAAGNPARVIKHLLLD